MSTCVYVWGGSSQFIFKRHFLKLIKLTPGWAGWAQYRSRHPTQTLPPLGTLDPPLPYTGLPFFSSFLFKNELFSVLPHLQTSQSPQLLSTRCSPFPPPAAWLSLTLSVDSPRAIHTNWDSSRPLSTGSNTNSATTDKWPKALLLSSGCLKKKTTAVNSSIN